MKYEVFSNYFVENSSEVITKEIDIIYDIFGVLISPTPSFTETITPTYTETLTETITPTYTETLTETITHTPNPPKIVLRSETQEGYLELVVETPLEFKAIAFSYDIHITNTATTISPIKNTIQECNFKNRYAIMSTNDTLIDFYELFTKVTDGEHTYYRLSFIKTYGETAMIKENKNGDVEIELLLFNTHETQRYTFDRVEIQGDIIVAPTPTISETFSFTPTPSKTESFTPSQTITNPTPTISHPTPTMSETISFTPSSSQTHTMSCTPTISQTQSETITESVSLTMTETITITDPTPTPTFTTTYTPSITHPTPTPTMSDTVTITHPTPTPTMSDTITITHPTPTPTMSDTITITHPTPTPTMSQTITFSDTITTTFTPTSTNTNTHTVSSTQSDTMTITETCTHTPSSTLTSTETYSVTPTISNTVSETMTNSVSITPSVSHTPSMTPSPTVSETITYSITPTQTQSISPSYSDTITYSITPTKTISETYTVTPSLTETISETYTVTPSLTETMTPSSTQSTTETVSESCTYTMTITNTQTCTESFSPTISTTNTYTPTITKTFTESFTPSMTTTESCTPTISTTNTYTPTVSGTFTETCTPTISTTNTYTPTVSETFTETCTPSMTTTVSQTTTESCTPTISTTNTYTPTVSETFTETVTHSYTPSYTITSSQTCTPTQSITCTFTCTPSVTHTYIPQPYTFVKLPGKRVSPLHPDSDFIVDEYLYPGENFVIEMFIQTQNNQLYSGNWHVYYDNTYFEPITFMKSDIFATAASLQSDTNKSTFMIFRPEIYQGVTAPDTSGSSILIGRVLYKVKESVSTGIIQDAFWIEHGTMNDWNNTSFIDPSYGLGTVIDAFDEGEYGSVTIQNRSAYVFAEVPINSVSRGDTFWIDMYIHTNTQQVYVGDWGLLFDERYFTPETFESSPLFNGSANMTVNPGHSTFLFSTPSSGTNREQTSGTRIYLGRASYTVKQDAPYGVIHEAFKLVFTSFGNWGLNNILIPSQILTHARILDQYGTGPFGSIYIQ